MVTISSDEFWIIMTVIIAGIGLGVTMLSRGDAKKRDADASRDKFCEAAMAATNRRIDMVEHTSDGIVMNYVGRFNAVDARLASIENKIDQLAGHIIRLAGSE